jgi:hypothetical protein
VQAVQDDLGRPGKVDVTPRDLEGIRLAEREVPGVDEGGLGRKRRPPKKLEAIGHSTRFCRIA